MDAEVSYEKFKNQSTSAKLGGSQGWFSPSLSMNSASTNIAQFAKVKIMRNHGDWEDLILPAGIKSIVCLNLPSFSGGFNPPSRQKRNQFTQPFVDDGHIEVVGFTSARHGQVFRAPKGRLLAQAHRIQFLFHKGATDQRYMKIDKVPWKQPLPSGDGADLMVEISHHCQVNILATSDCRCKSMHSTDDPLSARAQEDGGVSDKENLEEFRKFGAADTFKLREEIDSSRPSEPNTSHTVV